MALAAGALNAVRAALLAGSELAVPERVERLCEELTALAEEGIEARERLTALEELRAPLWQALVAYEQQQLARALPFSREELQRWRRYIEAWSLLLAAYLRALEDVDRGLDGVTGLGPLVIQRVVRHAVQVAVACFRAYQPVEPALWTLVHEHLRRAEKTGVTELAVADSTLSMEAHGTVLGAWLHLLLLDFCDPYGFSPAQLTLASRWTERLARLARLSLEPVAHGQAGFLVVDLAQGSGMQLRDRAAAPGSAGEGALRYVDLAGSRDQVKRLLAKLRLGMAPAELYLGADCTREEAEQVLERIARRWRTRQRRSHPRRPADEAVRVASGLPAIHRCLSQIAQGQPLEALAGLSESRLVDQSPSGLGLTQPEGGLRLRCLQLIALVGARELVLGSVRWLTVDGQSGLRFGVRVIGTRARAARLQTSATEPGSFDLALWLPEMPALAEPASLVAAPGTFFPDRELRFSLGEEDPVLLRLERLLEAGSDFERISYQPVP